MDISYLGVRHSHIAFVTLSITLFVVRAASMLRAPQRLQRPWVRIVPHIVDTLLLLSGVWLAWQLGAAGVAGWLPAKLLVLVAYILLGAIALRYGRTRNVRVAAAIGALATFAYMASVAVTKSPLGFLALL